MQNPEGEGGDWLDLLSTSAVPTVISIVQSRCHDNIHFALLAICHLGERSDAEDCRLKVLIPDLLNLLQHADDDIKSMALQALRALLEFRDGHDLADFAIEPCKHGGVPKLIEIGCGINQSDIIQCLEYLSQVHWIRAIALQHGILPLLCHSLKYLKGGRQDETQSSILKTLLCYPGHLHEVCHPSLIRQLLAIPRPEFGRDLAREVLSHLHVGSGSIRLPSGPPALIS